MISIQDRFLIAVTPDATYVLDLSAVIGISQKPFQRVDGIVHELAMMAAGGYMQYVYADTTDEATKVINHWMVLRQHHEETT